VIGGYGGFGARLCRRLAAAGHGLLVAGRSQARAVRFCASIPGEAEPVAMDRGGDVASLLALHRPDLVIDAAGPFQASGFGVPEACIANRIPYLDLADARDFVTGITALDSAAREAGVALISGASSLPALSGAVARRLAEGLDRVHSVDIALSAANRASGGASVVAAILSYVGRPVRLWRGGRWTHGFGWQEMQRECFDIAGGSNLRGRQVAIVDVPDCELLPALLPGRPAVTARAGTELRFQMWSLWLASWPVRWGWLRSLSSARRWLLTFYRATLALGGDRSAMSLTMKGTSGGRCLERRWTVIAESGHGIEVPTIAAALLADDVIHRRVPAGAYHAASSLPLERFDQAFAGLAIRHETVERVLPPPLYQRIMGRAFERLPAAIRAIHDLCGDAGAEGEGTVVRGAGRLARIIAAIMRLPPAGTYPLHVGFAERRGIERWTRDFGGNRFSSELSEDRGLVVERFGPLRFAFELQSVPDGLEMRLRRWSFCRIPFPLVLAPRIFAREWEEQGRFRFEVRVAVPLAGEVIHYFGRLTNCTQKKGGPEGPPIDQVLAETL
jgi:hypothetical protein